MGPLGQLLSADRVPKIGHGDPTQTFSDVEITVPSRIRRSGIRECQQRAAQSETEFIERALLKKLQQECEQQAVIRD
jgi:hypothetical protein